MIKITLSEDTIKRIDALKSELNKEFGFEGGREEVIEMALTAFEDVRGG